MAVKQGSSPKTSRRKPRRGLHPGDKIVKRGNKKRTPKGAATKLAHNDGGIMGIIEGASWRHVTAGTRESQSLTPQEVRSHIFKKLSGAVEKVADKYDWSDDLRSAAKTYMRSLVFGEGSPNAISKKMSKLGTEAFSGNRARQTVERRFATTCWYQRGRLGDVKLAGMDRPWFDKLYNSAKLL